MQMFSEVRLDWPGMGPGAPHSLAANGETVYRRITQSDLTLKKIYGRPSINSTKM